MYQALYRKWRPKTFDTVIGQKHITESLKNQLVSGHMSHAYIFIGSRGTGKTSCARILAKAVNCQNPANGNPCCECASCMSIDDGSAMDIVELDAASNNGVDNVRALRDEAVFSPASAKKRVYIIDEVHMLSTPAFNALLKILEEPPDHLMFILCTTELQKVPATILSRCQRHSFKRIETLELSEYLQHVASQEKLKLTKAGADLISGLAEGGVRDALSMLDQCSSYLNIDTDEVYASVGLAGNVRILHMYNNVINKNTASVIEEFDSLWKDGKDPAGMLRELSTLVRNILLVKVAPKIAGGLIYGGYSRNALDSFALHQSIEELSCIVSSIQNALTSMRDGLNPKITAELCLVSLCSEPAGDSISSLRARIAALEDKISSGNFQLSVIGDQLSEHVSMEECPSSIEESELCAQQSVVEKQEIPSERAVGLAITDDEFWKLVVKDAGAAMSASERNFLMVPGIAEGKLVDSVLEVYVHGGFYATMFSKTENIEALGNASEKVVGRKIGVKIVDLDLVPDSGPKMDINELRQFKEVKFI